MMSSIFLSGRSLIDLGTVHRRLIFLWVSPLPVEPDTRGVLTLSDRTMPIIASPEWACSDVPAAMADNHVLSF
jgi:hypothetical protein